MPVFWKLPDIAPCSVTSKSNWVRRKIKILSINLLGLNFYHIAIENILMAK